MSEEYNGHPNWASWNVSLWIGNEEGLYTYWKEQGQSIFESEADTQGVGLCQLECFDEEFDQDEFDDLVQEASRCSVSKLATQLRDEITCPFGDITDGDTMNSVNWRSVAEGILGEANFTTDEDHEVSFDLEEVYSAF